MKSPGFLPLLAGLPRRRPVLALLALLLVGIVVYGFARPRGEIATTAFHDAKQGAFTVSIVEGGTLAAVSEVSIRNEVEGIARIIYIVPEGSFVEQGDLLVELDSAQAQDQVNQQQIAYERAQFALIQAEQTLEIQKSATNSDIRAAALKLKFAELDLEKYEQGQRIVDLVEASNKLVQAEAQLAVNLDNYINTTNLRVRGYETRQKEDVDRLAVLNNRNSLIVASNSIWMLQKFDIPKQREKFQSDVREAHQELDRVIAQSIRKIAQYQADMMSQSNTLALNRRKLERDRKNLDATKIYAPQEGLVVYAVSENRFSSESLIEEGATVRNRQEIIKLPDTARMKVTIKVHESHVNMIRPGLPAFVILDSLPDERFAGVVEKVALLPDTQSRWGNPNLKVYNTDIYITDKLPDVKPGVSAKAEVIITNITDTLSVPIQAVTTLKGRQVVYVGSARNPEPRPVETGIYNTKFIQIVSGLRAGERVLLSPPFDTQTKDLAGEVLPPEEKARIKVTNAPPAGSPNPRARPGARRGTNDPAWDGPGRAPRSEADGADPTVRPERQRGDNPGGRERGERRRPDATPADGSNR